MGVSFRGAVTEIFLPWTESYEIDLSALKKHVEFQIESGIKGLYVNGLGTESIFLTTDDVVKLTKAVVEYAQGRIPVITNIQNNSLKGALDLQRRLQETNVDAMSIAQPFSLPFKMSTLKEYYEKIIENADRPIFINNTRESGNILNAEFVSDLVNRYPHVVGYKDSTLSMAHLQEVLNLVKKDNFEYVSGSDGIILPLIALGGHGVFSAISNNYPKLIIELCDLCLSGEFIKARELNSFVNKLRTVIKNVADIEVYKYIAKLMGIIPSSRVMSPLSEVTPEEGEYLKTELHKLGLL